MSDTQEFMKILKDWKKQDKDDILKVLSEIDNIKTIGGKILEQMIAVITQFHRQIGKAAQEQVDAKWFELTLNLKKKLKKWQQLDGNQNKPKPALEKNVIEIIEYPLELTRGRNLKDSNILKTFYKSFIAHFQEGEHSKQVIPFLQNLYKNVRYMYEDQLHSQHLINKRINSICVHLARESSRESKIRMLKGEITSQMVSKDEEEIYFDQKTRLNIRLLQETKLKQSSTGFYDEIKKNINKDACEECRYCHKKNAFCEDMKQIRASDQPMTRFMRCNTCGKAWRD